MYKVSRNKIQQKETPKTKNFLRYEAFLLQVFKNRTTQNLSNEICVKMIGSVMLMSKKLGRRNI